MDGGWAGDSRTIYGDQLGHGSFLGLWGLTKPTATIFSNLSLKTWPERGEGYWKSELFQKAQAIWPPYSSLLLGVLEGVVFLSHQGEGRGPPPIV